MSVANVKRLWSAISLPPPKLATCIVLAGTCERFNALVTVSVSSLETFTSIT